MLNRILRHNVRNKTNVIRGYAESIRDGSQSPHVAAEKIAGAADDLLTISEQIREFDAVLEKGGADRGALDIAAVVAAEVAKLEERSPEARVTFEGPSALQISAHHTLRPALTNLFELLDSPTEPEFEVSLEEKWDSVSLDVVDHGGRSRSRNWCWSTAVSRVRSTTSRGWSSGSSSGRWSSQAACSTSRPPVSHASGSRSPGPTERFRYSQRPVARSTRS